MSEGNGMGDMMAVVDNVGRIFRMPKGPVPPGLRLARRQTRIPKAQGKAVTTYPYFSSVRAALRVVTAGGALAPTVYLLPKGTVLRAFGYAIGDDLGVAGYPAGTIANDLHTNLVNRQQTNAGQTVRVGGISMMIAQDSDAGLLKVLAEKMSVTLAMNGEENKFRLGRLGFLPAAGGLNGGGLSNLIKPGVYDRYSDIEFFSNGLPGRDNYYPIPMSVIWKKAGSADSTLVIILEVKEDISFSVEPRAAGPAGSGIEEWIPPQVAGEVGTYVEFMLRLHTVQIAPRSVNQ